MFWGIKDILNFTGKCGFGDQQILTSVHKLVGTSWKQFNWSTTTGCELINTECHLSNLIKSVLTIVIPIKVDEFLTRADTCMS